MGQRPATPDTLPSHRTVPEVAESLLAFGHGHTGLTFGPTTGRLIAELVAGRRPSLDLSPFTIARFG
jgi:D-amino-acid dehydrogenase